MVSEIDPVPSEGSPRTTPPGATADAQGEQTGWTDREIREVYADEPDETTLWVYGDTCGEEGDLRIHESADEVVLRLQVRGEHVGDCNEHFVAPLEASLGGRALIDGNTGREIPIHR